MMVKRAIEQIHANDTERFLLIDIRFVKHAYMNDNLVRVAAVFLGLKSNAQPAVRFIVLFETTCRHCIRENEKRFLRPESRKRSGSLESRRSKISVTCARIPCSSPESTRANHSATPRKSNRRECLGS